MNYFFLPHKKLLLVLLYACIISPAISKQDATKYSSLQGVIVLDGLGTNFLHVENKKGMFGTG